MYGPVIYSIGKREKLEIPMPSSCCGEMGAAHQEFQF